MGPRPQKPTSGKICPAPLAPPPALVRHAVEHRVPHVLEERAVGLQVDEALVRQGAGGEGQRQERGGDQDVHPGKEGGRMVAGGLTVTIATAIGDLTVPSAP